MDGTTPSGGHGLRARTAGAADLPNPASPEPNILDSRLQPYFPRKRE